LAVPGNHDLRASALRLLAAAMPRAADAPPGLVCLHVTHGGLHFIGLDTVVERAAHGELGDEQLDWLRRTLRACAGQPTLIFMHHPPLVTGLAAMDACGLLRGRAELRRLVAEHGGVQLIASGHMHRPIAGQLGGASVVVATSASHQIDLDLRPGAPLLGRLEPPMIGLYRWTPEDGMACHFCHVQPFGMPLPL
jgi:3',5'-cyclic AMP phosphodiesterase CpdA